VAPRLPALEQGPIVLVDRPEAVQSNVRLAGRALARQDPDYPAMQLANLVFGGYFSSRLVENIREDKGYTYSPHCVIEHSAAGSAVMLQADVATEVTAPALVEIRYELGRIATLPVGEDELSNARQYAIGTLALSTATQAGLASMLTALLASGLGPEWLGQHAQRLAHVTVDQVREQAATFLAPSAMVTLVVGDVDRVGPELARLDEVAAQ
jgi:predicted Zn-dependent peptidase